MKNDFSSKMPPKTKERSPRRPKPRLWLLITTDEPEQPTEKAADIDPTHVPTLAKMLPKTFRDSSLSSSLDQDQVNELHGIAARERDPFEADCHHILVNRESERKPGNRRSVVRRVSSASKGSTDERLIVPVNSLYLNSVDPLRSSVPSFPISPDFTLCSPKRGASCFLATPGGTGEVSYCNLSMIEAAQPSPESNRTDYEILKDVLSPAEKPRNVFNTDGVHRLRPPELDNGNNQLTSAETEAVRILQQVVRSYLARRRMNLKLPYESNVESTGTGYLMPEVVENPKMPVGETQTRSSVPHIFFVLESYSDH
jgi:hypothetical protein